MAVTKSQGLWLGVFIVIGLCLISPLWVTHVSTCSAADDTATQSNNIWPYLLTMLSWIGTIMLGLPPLMSITTRFLLMDADRLQKQIDAHNAKIADKLGTDPDAKNKIQELTAAFPAPAGWRSAIDDMSKRQWWTMLIGFIMLVLSGLVWMLLEGHTYACT